MTGQQRILIERKIVNVEDLKTHTVEGERFQRELRTLFSRTVSSFKRETLRLIIKDSKLRDATIIIDVLVLHVCLRTSFRLTHIFNWSFWTYHRILLAFFSRNFLFSGIKWECETVARTTDSTSAGDELMFTIRKTLFF